MAMILVQFATTFALGQLSTDKQLEDRLEVRLMEYVISNSLDPPKLRALLLGSLSLITLSLSVFGDLRGYFKLCGNADPRDQYSNGLGRYVTAYSCYLFEMAC